MIEKSSKKVLLIGSGLAAAPVPGWNLQDWFVCCIHNAWTLIPSKFDILLHAMDYPEDRRPKQLLPHQRMVTTLEWVHNCNMTDHHSGFWRNHGGFGKTMFFTSLWWIWENLKPDVIGCIGCDMHYPEEGNNTIYGIGSPDPLKYNRQALLHWLGFIDGFMCRDGVTIINFSPYESPTLLPFSHGIFPNDKPIERPREHKTEYETYSKD